MSTVYKCDGCGSFFEDVKEIQELGRFKRRNYCRDCYPFVRILLKNLDNLQNKLTHIYTSKKDRMLSSFRKGHPQFKIPDYD